MHRSETLRLQDQGAVRISASLMCANQAALGVECQRLAEAGVHMLHFDIMDGHFVPNLAMSPAQIAALRDVVSLPFDVHLMVDTPEAYVDALAVSGADLVCFHLEACKQPLHLIERLVAIGLTPGIALHPRTPLDLVSDDVLRELKYTMIMGVDPGFAGQPFLVDTPVRVGHLAVRLEQMALRTPIMVDGHINAETASTLAEAGATLFVAGSSALFLPGEEYQTGIRRLEQAALSGVRKRMNRASRM